MAEQLATASAQIQHLLATVQQQQVAMIQLQQDAQGKGGGKGYGISSTRLGIDARQLGRPDKFDGVDSKFKDWSVVFRSFASLANSDIAAVMKDAELCTALRNAEMSDSGRVASTDLYRLLLNLCIGTAFAKIVNAGEGEGALAWKAIIDRWDPKMRTRQAGILLSVLKWSFACDILGRMESFERE